MKHSPPRSSVLIALALKGYAAPEAIAEVFGVTVPDLQPILDALSQVDFLKPAVEGVKLSRQGRHAADVLWRQEAAAADQDVLHALKGSVAALDDVLRPIFSDWLMRKTQDGPARNTHRDPAYDAALLERLIAQKAEIHAAAKTLGAEVPRCASYALRLARAGGAMECGDHRYMTNPDVDSYQAIWLELQADLARLAV